MQAELTRYAVAGWGDGELWCDAGVVLAHDFRFSTEAGRDEAAPRLQADQAARNRPARTRPARNQAAPHLGGPSSPLGTVLTQAAREANGFVTIVRGRGGGAGDADDADFARAVVERLRSFLAGEPVDLADVPLELGGSTPFQEAVATTLREVPRGEVVSYGELAALAGYPGAQRAVGTFCARNRFMLLVPCHRVVAADGIGGYGSSGTGVKRRLLGLEGVEL